LPIIVSGTCTSSRSRASHAINQSGIYLPSFAWDGVSPQALASPHSLASSISAPFPRNILPFSPFSGSSQCRHLASLITNPPHRPLNLRGVRFHRTDVSLLDTFVFYELTSLCCLGNSTISLSIHLQSMHARPLLDIYRLNCQYSLCPAGPISECIHGARLERSLTKVTHSWCRRPTVKLVLLAVLGAFTN
jgi:hypothetical protein